MTYRQFLDKLSQTQDHPTRTWRLNPRGCIEQVIEQEDRDLLPFLNPRHCPLSAVTGDPEDFLNPAAAGRRLGLRTGLVQKIVAAADDLHWHPRIPRIRWDLLRAVGLQEPRP